VIGFIEQIIAEMPESVLPELKGQCFVFPTRRAVFHFKHVLKKRFKDQAFWAPQVFSINDFILHCTKGSSTDDLRLIYELYEVHRDLYSSDLKFESFYPWGTILLRDFDEIDKYLVDAKQLYTLITSYKEIEDYFSDDDEVKEAIALFRSSLKEKDQSKIQSGFASVWDTLYEIHQAFSERLETKGFGYDGKYYRQLSDQLINETIDLEFSKVTFIGFNALSKAEESIMDSLLVKGIGEIYWDTDKYYLDNKLQEAGKFNREYKRKWQHPNSKWIIHDSFSAEDKFNLIGTVESVGQAKIAHEIVHSKVEAGTLNPEKTGIVMCAEHLLFPVLYSLPQSIEQVNITMGYPLKYTALYGFTETIIDLQKQASAQNGQAFSRKALQRITTNSIVAALFPSETRRLKKLSETEKTGTIDLVLIQKEIGRSKLSSIFENKSSHQELLDWLIDLYTVFFYRQKDLELDSNLNKEMIYHFLVHLIKMKRLFMDSSISVSINLLHKLILESCSQVKVPFSGEPLKGLQIMGFLESRTLDFEELIILSCNEGNIPASRSNKSFIPYSLRQAFGLPTFEDQDAIYAYHFMRLLQRAKKVHLVYNIEAGKMGGQEKSRFLQQLEAELPEGSIEPLIFSRIGVEMLDEFPIKIKKSPEIIRSVKSKLNDRGLSPSALSTYLSCSLRYYFKYVAKMKSVEESNEELNAAEMGTLAHDILENVYKPHIGKTLEAADIKAIRKSGVIQEESQKLLSAAGYVNTTEGLNGINQVMTDILLSLIDKVLEEDAKRCPFTITAIENEAVKVPIIVGDEKVVLTGKIDRVDNHNIVIDYKTGKAVFSGDAKAPEVFIADIFEDSTKSAPLQLYFYNYLLSKSDGNYNPEEATTGVYSFNELNQGIKYLHKGNAVGQEALDIFEEKLVSIIEEILDKEIPFEKTEDEGHCHYCDFNEICQRLDKPPSYS